MTASPINRMLPGSLAERHEAHQRSALDEHRGAVLRLAGDVVEERYVQGLRASTR